HAALQLNDFLCDARCGSRRAERGVGPAIGERERRKTGRIKGKGRSVEPCAVLQFAEVALKYGLSVWRDDRNAGIGVVGIQREIHRRRWTPRCGKDECIRTISEPDRSFEMKGVIDHA